MAWEKVSYGTCRRCGNTCQDLNQDGICKNCVPYMSGYSSKYYDGICRICGRRSDTLNNDSVCNSCRSYPR